MFGLVCNIGAEVPSYKAVPVSIILSVEFVFQVSGHLLCGVHLLQGVFSRGQYISFHLWTDISCLDDGFILFVFLHFLVISNEVSNIIITHLSLFIYFLFIINRTLKKYHSQTFVLFLFLQSCQLLGSLLELKYKRVQIISRLLIILLVHYFHELLVRVLQLLDFSLEQDDLLVSLVRQGLVGSISIIN